MIDEDRIEGFEAFERKPDPEQEEPKATVPVFGRRVKRYRKGL